MYFKRKKLQFTTFGQLPNVELLPGVCTETIKFLADGYSNQVKPRLELKIECDRGHESEYRSGRDLRTAWPPSRRFLARIHKSIKRQVE